jgi:hypothetical protein
MAVTLAPLFYSSDDKNSCSLIVQLEHEAKSEKDDQGKDALKEKKVFDEKYNISYTDHASIIVATTILHTRENSLFVQTYHPVVPTPPPNA